MSAFPVADLVFDPEVYPRLDGWSQATVNRYVEAIAAAGDVFPPVVLETGTNRLLDGVHRWLAHKQSGRDVIDATWTVVPEGLPARVFTASLGTRHGDRLKGEDLRAIARDAMADNPDLEISTLAGMWGITRQTVSKWVGDLAEQSRILRQAKVLLLLRAGWKQKQVAAMVGVDQSTISRMQNVNALTFCIDPAVVRQAAMALPVSSDVADALIDEMQQAHADLAEPNPGALAATGSMPDGAGATPEARPAAEPDGRVTPPQTPAETPAPPAPVFVALAGPADEGGVVTPPVLEGGDTPGGEEDYGELIDVEPASTAEVIEAGKLAAEQLVADVQLKVRLIVNAMLVGSSTSAARDLVAALRAAADELEGLL